MEHLWIWNHPAKPSWMPDNVWYCPFCGCWTANKGQYEHEVCEGRVQALKDLAKQPDECST